ncbi:MAG: DUF5810 domain-containing protein [Halalkalicoccus sp.]
MGYACPVCAVPQQDPEHLANHLAFAAILGNEDHEEWLDEHVPGWGEMGPDELGERAATFAPEREFETTVEDPAGRGAPRLEDAVPRQRGRQAVGGEESEILAEARAMTREMLESEEE